MAHDNSAVALPNASPNPGAKPDGSNNDSAVLNADDVPLETLRTWCVVALNSSSSGVISLERLCEICRGTAAATGVNFVEPIDVGRIALALTADADWEVVCRPSRPRSREDC